MERYINDEIAETAMCIWEWVIENNNDPRIELWKELNAGTASLRLHCLHLAKDVEVACIEIYNKTNLAYWNKPFDWEIIPRVMNEYLSHIAKQGFHRDPIFLGTAVYNAWDWDKAPEEVFDNA